MSRSDFLDGGKSVVCEERIGRAEAESAAHLEPDGNCTVLDDVAGWEGTDYG